MRRVAADSRARTRTNVVQMSTVQTTTFVAIMACAGPITTATSTPTLIRGRGALVLAFAAVTSAVLSRVCACGFATTVYHQMMTVRDPRRSRRCCLYCT